jgi:hypothetical protein
MTQEEALKTVQIYFRSFGIESPGLNEKNLGGVANGEAQIYFEYRPAEELLKCSALIYKFQLEPKPGVIDQFKEEAQVTDTGGGKLDYEAESRALCLSRSYCEPITEQQFARDLAGLIDARRVWSEEVLDRVAAKIFHPDEFAIST